VVQDVNPPTITPTSNTGDRIDVNQAPLAPQRDPTSSTGGTDNIQVRTGSVTIIIRRP
jgi:hypothetical protein